jgi:hypothetical protein
VSKLQQTEQIAALQKKLAQLSQENQVLKAELLQNKMEKAVSDEAMSQEMGQHMEDFFGVPCSRWYTLLLFHGKRPETADALRPEARDPMKTVTSVFVPILDKAGKTFFFPIKGELGCLMNLRVSDNFPGSEEGKPADTHGKQHHAQNGEPRLPRLVEHGTGTLCDEPGVGDHSGLLVQGTGPRQQATVLGGCSGGRPAGAWCGWTIPPNSGGGTHNAATRRRWRTSRPGRSAAYADAGSE